MDERMRAKQEGSSSDSCLPGPDAYPETIQVCAQAVCIICEDGKWVELESVPEV